MDYKIVTGPVIVACALSGAVAYAQLAGQPYQDQATKFALTIPQGWTSEKLTDPNGPQVQFNSPNAQQTGGNCNVFMVPYPDWANRTQEQINTDIANKVFESAVADEMRTTGQNPTMAVNEPRNLGPVNIQYAEYEVDFGQPGQQTFRLYVQKIITAVPGRVYNVNCAALAQVKAQEVPNFNTLMGSFTITP